jgi:carbon-monoxide dehydrogenase catalytic subunit
VPPAGTFLQQELAIITGACDAMVVDIQCHVPEPGQRGQVLSHQADHHPPHRQDGAGQRVHIEFDEHHAMEDAKSIVKMAIDNFQNRGSRGDDSRPTRPRGGRFRRGVHRIPPGRHLPRHYYTLNDNIINGRIRGIAGVVGCNNARTRHNEAHIASSRN